MSSISDAGVWGRPSESRLTKMCQPLVHRRHGDRLRLSTDVTGGRLDDVMGHVSRSWPTAGACDVAWFHMRRQRTASWQSSTKHSSTIIKHCLYNAMLGTEYKITCNNTLVDEIRSIFLDFILWLVHDSWNDRQLSLNITGSGTNWQSHHFLLALCLKKISAKCHQNRSL